MIDLFAYYLENSVFKIKQRKIVFNVTQEPLAVWFINASWEHRVINMNNDKRLALLGCFEYNK